MRALTVRQPYAHWMFNEDEDFGIKTVENRTWSTSYRGDVLIHAGASAHQDYEGTLLLEGINERSAILGVVELVDVHLYGASCSPGCVAWGERNRDSQHWILANPRRFERPVPCSGALQVWNTRRLLPIVEQEIEHQMALIGVRA